VWTGRKTLQPANAARVAVGLKQRDGLTVEQDEGAAA
jgi:hypothetical protein